jgi:hypothetical protein
MPLPEPEPPEVFVIHGALLAAVHWLDAEEAVTEIDPVDPAAVRLVEPGMTWRRAANAICRTPWPKVVAYRLPLARRR